MLCKIINSNLLVCYSLMVVNYINFLRGLKLPSLFHIKTFMCLLTKMETKQIRVPSLRHFLLTPETASSEVTPDTS